MPTVGNKRRVYITNSAGSQHTVLKGEQTNSYSRSMSPIEVTDKDVEWANFLAGKKSATADVTVNLDNKATEAQHTLLTSFAAGDTVFVFIGQLSGEGNAQRTEGDAFEALITAVNDTSDQESVCSRQISLQVTGEPTHYPQANE